MKRPALRTAGGIRQAGVRKGFPAFSVFPVFPADLSLGHRTIDRLNMAPILLPGWVRLSHMAKNSPSSRPEPEGRSGGTYSVASATRRGPSATPPVGRLRSG